MLATYTDGTVSQSNLYTTDASGSLKAFNLLNISDAFGTDRKSGTSETYYLYIEDLKGSMVNVPDNSASRVVFYLSALIHWLSGRPCPARLFDIEFFLDFHKVPPLLQQQKR